MSYPRVGVGDESGPGDSFLEDLARWAADERASEDARSRTQERALRQAAEQEATFAGVLVDLAERGDVVLVGLASGRSHRGPLLAVGRDFVALRDPHGQPVFLALSAVTDVRLLPGARAGDTTGSARLDDRSSMAAVLAGLAGEGRRVRVGTWGDVMGVAGELRAVGTDVVTLRLDTRPPTTVYLRLEAVSEVVLVDWR